MGFPPFKMQIKACMKTGKIILWDEIDHEADFYLPLSPHPETKETDVFRFQLREPGVKPISMLPIQAAITEVSTVNDSKLPRSEIQTQNQNRESHDGWYSSLSISFGLFLV